jgi:predicted ATP-grasp superfamily ATP-dependent carboligase
VVGIGFHAHVGYPSRYFSERIVAASEEDDDKPDMLQALERIARRGRPVVMPATEGTVSWVIDNWDAVRELGDMSLPDDVDTVRRLRQKDLLGATAERAGVPAPRTVRPHSSAELRQADLNPPLLIKPIEGKDFTAAFGQKLFSADTIDEAVDHWERARSLGFDTIAQELVPGHEGNIYSFFGYLDGQQRPLASVVGRKARDAPRPFGSSAVFLAKWNGRVYDRAVALLQSSGYRGFAHVELAYDARIDDFVLIEVNTRVPTWAGIGMTHDFNMGKVAYVDLCGDGQESIEMRRSRLWVDLIEDVRAGPPYNPVKLARFIGPYLRPHSIGALFAVDDPVPALKEGRRVLRANLRVRTRVKASMRRLLALNSRS